jgi:hypothetical protein
MMLGFRILRDHISRGCFSALHAGQSSLSKQQLVNSRRTLKHNSDALSQMRNVSGNDPDGDCFKQNDLVSK